jgi:spermidine/putrescine transport system substrate-binding protein
MNRRCFSAFALSLLALVTVPAPRGHADEQIGGEINILSWGNYIDFALPDFEKRYGVKVNIDYYADEQEAMNKIRAAGLGTHDIVFLGAGFEDIALKQNLLAPLDVSQVPALDDLFPQVKKVKDDGKIYCGTYSFGLNGLIAYDPAKTGGKITSWKDVFSGKYKDRVGKIDKSNEQVWRTALSLGYKYGALSPEQWDAVGKKLSENMQQVRTVFSHNDQMAQLLGSGEIWIGDSDDGSYRQARAKGLAIDVAYPEEGMTAWYDGPCIVAEAPHEKAAYAFVNYMLSPEVQARLPKELGYAPANSKAIALLDEKTRKDMDLDALVANLDKIQFQYNLGGDFDKKAIDLWEKAKAAGAH